MSFLRLPPSSGCGVPRDSTERVDVGQRLGEVAQDHVIDSASYALHKATSDQFIRPNQAETARRQASG